MTENCENKQRPEEVAENVVKTGSGVAETIVNAANEFTTETVIPSLADGIKSFTNDDNSKETIDKVSDATKKTASVAARIISKIIKTGSEILTDDVIPTVSEIVRGDEKVSIQDADGDGYASGKRFSFSVPDRAELSP